MMDTQVDRELLEKIADLVKEADQRMYQCKSRNHERISQRGAAE